MRHFMFIIRVALVVVCGCITINSLAQRQTSESRINYKLRSNLAKVLTNTPEGELIPVAIVMQDQVPRVLIQKAYQIKNKHDKRVYVTDLLKQKALDTQADILEFLSEQQVSGNVGEGINSLWIHNVIGARVTPEVVYTLAAREDVAYINYDTPIGPEVFPVINKVDEAEVEEEYDDGGGGVAGLVCGVDLIDADRVWYELGITGKDIVVGVIDTGLCLTHPDIQNQVWTNPGEIPNNGIDDDSNGYVDDINGWNFESNNNDVNDTYGHGSHVSGTVAGDGTGGEQCGVAPDAQIQSLKFWNSVSGEQSIWDAMQYGVDNNADVLTASLGWSYYMNPDRAIWRFICENTIAAGVVVIYSAGSNGCNNPPYDISTPGDVPDNITVGATDCNDDHAYFSSCGPVTWKGVMPWDDWPYPPGKIKPTISAPGINTLSHDLCSDYTYMSGTSMATPHIAGTVALMLEANPDLDHFAVKQILMDTAVDLGAPGMDNQYGAGRVNAYEAVLVALEGSGVFKLEIVGTCPGLLTANTRGSNAGDRVAYAYAYHSGSTKVPPCPGLFADLLDPKLIGIKKADANGATSLQGRVPSGLCGRVLVQAFNIDTCEKSKVAGI